MIANIENEFLNVQTENPNSIFQNIQLNFDSIEEIKKNSENDLDNFYLENESEISNLMSSVYDVNQIYLNPTYFSKIVENKIKKFYSFNEFFLYFKNEPKIQKLSNEETIKININENKRQKNEKVKNKEEEINFKTSEENKEVKKKTIIEKMEKDIEENKNDKENEEDINNNEKEKESKNKSKSSISENNDSNSSKSKINLSNSSIKQISLNEISPDKNLISEIIVPELLERNKEELFEGKDFESRVRSYFKLFLECCTEKDIKIESNLSRDIKLLYQVYEKIIDKDKSKKNEYISGNSVISSLIVEFDIVIKNITKDIILNIEQNFKGNIIYSSELNSLDEKKNYQIIGEVAKNILYHSSNKFKQINKYVDIILINETLKNFEHIDDKDKEIIKLLFDNLNLNYYDDKIIMIFTDGSYVNLLKAIKYCENQENIFLSNREKKDIQNFIKMIDLLRKSKIPFIIFYMPNDLRNNKDDFLIEHAKNLNEIKNNLKDDIYKSYSLKFIDEEIDKFKKYILEYISYSCLEQDTTLEAISHNLYNEIIDKINPINIFRLELIIFKNENSNIKDIEGAFSLIIDKKCFEYKKEIINDDNALNEYIKKNKKIPDDTFRILICETELDKNIEFLYDKIESFSLIIKKKDIGKKIFEILRDFKAKFKNYFSQQIKKKIYKNHLFYSNNKEYLNGKNLIKKISYDLLKLNINITLQKNENDLYRNKTYKELLNSIKEIDFIKQIKWYYNNEIGEEKTKVLNFKEEYFNNLNRIKFNVFEEFYCWRIYELFVGIVIKNIIK